MGIKTKIDWADATWNPVTGCLHNCEYCYASKIAARFDGNTDNGLHVLDEPVYEPGIYYKIRPYPFGFAPTFLRYKLDEVKNWKKPKTIFVCSMADLFGAWVPEEWIMEVFETCQKAPQHTYLFLTKNPDRYCKLADEDKLPRDDNFWWGSTVDHMGAKIYPGRIADHTFVSIEPLREEMDVGLGSFGSAEWIIIGAETGNRKGKVVPKKEWVDKICKAADITHAAVFMKESLENIVENMRKEVPWNATEEKDR